MKKVFLGLALCAFAFVSCNDDNGNNGDGNSTAIVDNTINGTLKRVLIDHDDVMSFDGDITDEIDEIAGYIYITPWEGKLNCSALVSNGLFSLKLATPGSIYLDDITTEMPETLTISDRNAKWADFYLNGRKEGFYQNAIMLYPANLSDKIEFGIKYVDRDVTIRGSYASESDYDGGEYDSDYESEGEAFTVNVNLNFKKGWNIVAYRETSVTSTTDIPANTVWAATFWEPYDSNIFDEAFSSKFTKGFKTFRK